jgi:hypothetical protein
MTACRPWIVAVAVFGVAGLASGQAPPPATSAPVTPEEAAAATPLTDPYMPAYSSGHRFRPRTSTQPAPSDPDAEYGFRNPGGVGRVKEFYPPGNTFERGDDRVRTARFDNGPSATSRQSQMMAQYVGNERTRTFNSHIDAYARPFSFGFGYGLGLGGYGYGSRYPY